MSCRSAGRQASRDAPPAEWNDTRADYPADLGVHTLFEAQVERSPNAIAVECGRERLTYSELNESADRLTGHLVAAGVQSGDLVGISTERSAAMLAGILAILKAGAAYVPLDPEYPAERLA
ncbi:MAG TPA: AMP-binding protein, partial [Chloroflexota bacterium]